MPACACVCLSGPMCACVPVYACVCLMLPSSIWWCVQNGLVDALEFLTTFALASAVTPVEKIRCTSCLLAFFVYVYLFLLVGSLVCLIVFVDWSGCFLPFV